MAVMGSLVVIVKKFALLHHCWNLLLRRQAAPQECRRLLERIILATYRIVVCVSKVDIVQAVSRKARGTAPMLTHAQQVQCNQMLGRQASAVVNLALPVTHVQPLVLPV